MFLIFFFALAYSQNRCDDNGRVWASPCLSQDGTTCSTKYTWNVNPLTANFIGQPVKCEYNTTSSKCLDNSIYPCIPDCVLNPQAAIGPHHKIGGPNGKVCSDFTTQTDCAKYYVDDYGDRWCFWKNGACSTGPLCYN